MTSAWTRGCAMHARRDIEMSCAWDKDQSKAVANADGHVIRCLQGAFVMFFS